MALKINTYIEQEILDYIILQINNNSQYQSINNNSNQNPAKNINIIDTQQNGHQKNKTNEEQKLEESLESFDKIKVAGDGNCLISSILTYLNIPPQHTTTLRNQMAKAAEDYEWDKEILTSLNYEDNLDIAEKIKTPNSFIGYMK